MLIKLISILYGNLVLIVITINNVPSYPKALPKYFSSIILVYKILAVLVTSEYYAYRVFDNYGQNSWHRLELYKWQILLLEQILAGDWWF